MAVLIENDLLLTMQLTRWQQLVACHQAELATLTDEQTALLKQALSLSDFVYQSIERAAADIIPLFQAETLFPKADIDYLSALRNKLKTCERESELHKILRLYRCQEMVRIAVGDMLGQLPLKRSLSALSELAEALIIAAQEWLTNLCQKQWGIPQDKQGNRQTLLVFAMGKLGGKELNFSSDIDLIFSYPAGGETVGARRALDNQQFFIRLGQKLITALHQVTEHGFVYRVDMRLRPFGESGPLVMSFSALESYYQEQGRDWERYAMLKARLIGDSPYHQTLEQLIKPFVYRRYIDFSVIESLRKMKRMIAQEVRRKHLINNIKLGAGGIREVEFIVQVFQLIRGGREPKLQQRNLLTVLPLLFEHGEIEHESYKTLENAYCFLRRVENIIQAFADQQTQTLPDDELNQARLITILAYQSWSDFLVDVNQHMQAVHQAFSEMIGEESPNHQAHDEHWQTLLLSDWSAEESIEYIEEYAPFWSGTEVWQLLKQFTDDINKRAIGLRGRQVLDKLLPLLLWHLQQNKASITVFERVSHILKCIITRTAYLELLFENEGALKHLIKLCSASNWVAEQIANHPILLDELIDPQLLHNPPALSHYASDLQQVMLRIPEDDLEAQMNILRQFKQAQQLRIAAADISGVLPIMKVSDHLTALAEAILAEVINIAWRQLTLKHGVPNSLLTTNDKGLLVIGYGKMGGLELGYSSDLDLVFIHNSELDDKTSGNKPLTASHFYIKLAQKMMLIFNTRMASGILYELDLRLRPSGNSGLLMVNIDNFAKYQQVEAWIWEHQALVRARAIYGSLDLVNKFNHIRQMILSLPRNTDELKTAVVDMRAKMRSHLDKSSELIFDVKQGQGGLVDIEFLAQYLVLNNSHQLPDITEYSDNVRIFELLAKYQLITPEEAEQLIATYCQLRDFGHRLSLQNQPNQSEPELFAEQTQSISQIVNKYLA
ncbi:bifunctional [glutamate--ammonia ligase]-adenylyl-L-tyrosine phosphorylase/[glutamate--ammonia-ligase] adenylyltransferase [Thalassotalea agariperforans]